MRVQNIKVVVNMRYLIFDTSTTKDLPNYEFYHSKRLIFIEESKLDLDYLLDKLLKFEKKEFTVIDLKELVKTVYYVKNRREYDKKISYIEVMNEYMIYYIYSDNRKNTLDMSVADFKTNSKEEYIDKVNLLKQNHNIIGFHVWNTRTNELTIYEKNNESQDIHEKSIIYKGNLFEYRYLVEDFRKKYRMATLYRNKRDKVSTYKNGKISFKEILTGA